MLNENNRVLRLFIIIIELRIIIEQLTLKKVYDMIASVFKNQYESSWKVSEQNLENMFRSCLKRIISWTLF